MGLKMCSLTEVPDSEAVPTTSASSGQVWRVLLTRQKAASSPGPRGPGSQLRQAPEEAEQLLATHPWALFSSENAKVLPQSDVFAGPGTAPRGLQ